MRIIIDGNTDTFVTDNLLTNEKIVVETIKKSFTMRWQELDKYEYNLKLDDIKEVNSNKSVQDEKTQYEFLSYVICKNPLCNYDIELKGYVFEYPKNVVNSIELVKLK